VQLRQGPFVAALSRLMDISSGRDCSDPKNRLVGDNTVMTFTRTAARFVVLAGIVTVAGCGSYDNPKQATKTDETAVAAAQPAAEQPAE